MPVVGWVERERNPPFWRIGRFPLRSYPPDETTKRSRVGRARAKPTILEDRWVSTSFLPTLRINLRK